LLTSCPDRAASREERKLKKNKKEEHELKSRREDNCCIEKSKNQGKEVMG
jgi:hypothetical protein